MRRMIFFGLVVIFVHIACGTAAQPTSSTTFNQAATRTPRVAATRVPLTEISAIPPTLDVMATATLFALQVQETQTAEPAPTEPVVVATTAPTDTHEPAPTQAPTQVPTDMPPTNTDVPVIATVPPTDGPKTPSGQTQGPIIIVSIFENGEKGQNEPDEYTEIANQSTDPVNLSRWRLNAGAEGQDFYFPNDFVMQPGQTCRIYTNEIHPESCGLSFGNARAIWKNDGDCGILFNEQNVEVSRKCF